LLDLFVNNEKTLLKIYEALFPHRVTVNNTSGVSGTQNVSMMENSTANQAQQPLPFGG